MRLTDANSEQLTPLQSSGILGRQLALDPTAGPEGKTCRLQVDQVIRQIDCTPIRDLVGNVFQDLLRLLDCLSVVEGHLRQVENAEVTFAFFQLIHDDAFALVNFIRSNGLNPAVMGDELAETLDGIAFAVHHDLQRVFDRGPGLSFTDKPPQVVVGKLFRAHDVLTNCLQQSTITLAMLFDSNLIGAKLFNNSDIRYRQSLQLCQELSELIELVDNSEKASVTTELTTLKYRIERFRNESMECLMYSDWPQFESFCERINFWKTQSVELLTILHQFRCYLETLLGQVRMRNVLADVFPLGIGEEDNCGVLTTLAKNSASFSESFPPQDEEVVSTEFAFTV